MDEGTWAFTFEVVADGATQEEALEQALVYIAEMAQRGELEPTESERVE